MANVDCNIYEPIEIWDNFNRPNICVIAAFKEKKERKEFKIFGEIMIENFSNLTKHPAILLTLLSASNIIYILCSENMGYITQNILVIIYPAGNIRENLVPKLT